MFKRSRIRRLVEGTALVGACALSVLVARPAEACGVPESGLNSSVPEDGAIYPRNAALLFDGWGIGLDGITVTVDGEPAELLPAAFDDFVADLAVVVEPTPMTGQTVVVSGSFCPDEDCEPVTITYTAGPEDAEAPQPLVEESFFAVYDHADFMSSGGDCMSDSDLTLYVHLSQAIPAPGEPSLFTIAWDPDGEGELGFRRTVRVPTGARVAPLSLVTEQLGGKDPRTEVCLEVTAFDAAGNAADTFELCPACFAREDALPRETETPPEPDWTEADGVPGSPCAGEQPLTTGEEPTGTDTSPTSSGGDSLSESSSDSVSDTYSGGATGGDSGDKGCACSTHGGDPGDAGRFLLFVLGLGLALVKRRS
ncbi:MYXO-CTERM sorting domain-containing protein [Nannocystis sp. ILAH1]|uniref:MYXO-CTERM sorting domain-containing protein n=1 Tax=Nannocystis sp. ILAH1 TaxID=2996789 RepID=UPI00226E65D2|nr:MYXO-CTERM sorting domain-containing protein [Nannocystis sp. ILAH1]MCY0989440.1 MYXO-CTERM sorting domain-containing protein [Nannocystis sp. ILAH1]